MHHLLRYNTLDCTGGCLSEVGHWLGLGLGLGQGNGLVFLFFFLFLSFFMSYVPFYERYAWVLDN